MSKVIAVIDASRAALFILPMPSEEYMSSKMGGDDTNETEALEAYIEETCNARLSDSNWQVCEQIEDYSKAHKRGAAVPFADVYNMSSGRSNKEVPNQFVITTEEGTYFKSYASMIAFIPRGGGKTVLDESKWDYSTTTGKYRNQFLGEDKAATERKIKSGEYVLANLNK